MDTSHEHMRRLAKVCTQCPYMKTCGHKQFEAAMMLGEELSIDTAIQIQRETKNIRIGDSTVQVYKDEFEKELRKTLYDGLGINYGHERRNNPWMQPNWRTTFWTL